MTRKIAHLTVNGRPLCQCSGYDRLVTDMVITCGYCSLADAKRAKAELQKHVAGVKAVAGGCPAYGEEA